MVAIIAVAALGFLAAFADRVIFVWIGKSLPDAAWTIRSLASTEFLVLLTGVATASLRAKRMVKLEALFAVISALTLVLSIGPLCWVAGYAGIIYARTLGHVVGALWILVSFFRLEGMSVKTYAREVVVRVLFGGALASLLIIFCRSLNLDFEIQSLPAGWNAIIEVVVWSVPFLGVVLGATWFLILSGEERDSLGSYVRKRLRRSAVT